MEIRIYHTEYHYRFRTSNSQEDIYTIDSSGHFPPTSLTILKRGIFLASFERKIRLKGIKPEIFYSIKFYSIGEVQIKMISILKPRYSVKIGLDEYLVVTHRNLKASLWQNGKMVASYTRYPLPTKYGQIGYIQYDFDLNTDIIVTLFSAIYLRYNNGKSTQSVIHHDGLQLFKFDETWTPKGL